MQQAAPRSAMVRLILLCAIGASVAYVFRSYFSVRSRNGSPMGIDEAAALLDVSTMASVEDIKAAHRRAIKAAHPDAGGEASDAARINLARDTLLAYHRRYES